MLVSELVKLIEAENVTPEVEDVEVSSGYTCDLLSWVMAKGKAGCAWVTVQTHMNVVAVASLHDMACIICPEGIEPEADSVKKAAEEGIAVLKSPKTAYEICVLMGGAGVPAV
ncbi:AraC family transcriptional regulator [Christensenellaceae bacterium OttesenSCG-928-M15]|nr:AraC family transcriptional regulator [Christensenellaceae bacterium OttesenSCG-928-M15]